VGNVWLKLVICCLRSKYKTRARVRWPETPDFGLSDRDGPSTLYTLMGAFALAKGGRLALATVLCAVFHHY